VVVEDLKYGKFERVLNVDLTRDE
jgi:hypothetical protein